MNRCEGRPATPFSTVDTDAGRRGNVGWADVKPAISNRGAHDRPSIRSTKHPGHAGGGTMTSSAMSYSAMRCVLDTDVVVAAMRSPKGASAALLLAALDGRIELVANVALVLEYESVCLRD